MLGKTKKKKKNKIKFLKKGVLNQEKIGLSDLWIDWMVLFHNCDLLIWILFSFASDSVKNSLCFKLTKSQILSLKNTTMSSDPKPEFICPITQEPMIDPVVCSDGNTYERKGFFFFYFSFVFPRFFADSFKRLNLIAFDVRWSFISFLIFKIFGFVWFFFSTLHFLLNVSQKKKKLLGSFGNVKFSLVLFEKALN